MNNERDRISELPDGVLGHIQSFLDTKWAFRTTALSKRWRNLVWDSLTTLHFDESSFPNQSDFKEIMDHVLARRVKTLPLYKLIFITFRSSSGKFANKLLDYAMSNTLTHLQLCFLEGFVKINPVLNSLPMSLRVLKLNAKGLGFINMMKTPLCLPKLEILHLQRFVLEPNLLSECENLVELSIVRCLMKEKLIVSAPKLSDLTFSYACHYGNGTIMLMVPKLTFFKLKTDTDEIPVIHTDDFVHLKTAILQISTSTMFEVQHVSVMNILQKLCNAHHVSLSLPTLQLLHQIGGALEVPLSPFLNLKTFRITNKEKRGQRQVIMQQEGISISVINQVLNTVFQRSLSDVESFVHFPRLSKPPRI